MKVLLLLSSWESWYRTFRASPRNGACFSRETSLGMKPMVSSCCRMAASNERLWMSFRTNSQIDWWCGQGTNLCRFWAMFSCWYISFLFSAKIESFFKNLKTTSNNAILSRCNIVIKYEIIFLFFIFLSIVKSSAKLSKIEKHTNYQVRNKSLFCFFSKISNFFCSFSRSCLDFSSSAFM